MPILFGTDINAEIADALADGLPSAILTKLTRTPAAEGSTAAPTETSMQYMCNAIVEIKTKTFPERQTWAEALVVGLPDDIKIKRNDTLRVENQDWEIIEIMKRDPAGASWKCEVKEI